MAEQRDPQTKDVQMYDLANRVISANVKKTDADAEAQNQANQLQAEMFNEFSRRDTRTLFRRTAANIAKYGNGYSQLQEQVNRSPFAAQVLADQGVTMIQNVFDENTVTEGSSITAWLSKFGISPDMYSDEKKRKTLNKMFFRAYDPQSKKYGLYYLPKVLAEFGVYEDMTDEERKEIEKIQEEAEAILFPEETTGEAAQKTLAKQQKGKGNTEDPELTAAKIKKTLSEGLLADAKARGFLTDAQYRELEMQWLPQEKQADVDNTAADTKLKLSQAGHEDEKAAVVGPLAKAEIASKESLTNLRNWQSITHKDEAAATINLKKSEEEVNNTNRKLIQARIDNLDANDKQRRELEAAQAGYYVSKAGYYDRMPAEGSKLTPFQQAQARAEGTAAGKDKVRQEMYGRMEAPINAIGEMIRTGNAAGIGSIKLDTKQKSAMETISRPYRLSVTRTQFGKLVGNLETLTSITDKGIQGYRDETGPLDHAITKLQIKFLDKDMETLDGEETRTAINSLFTAVRQTLYGATLTDNEILEWKKIAANEEDANFPTLLNRVIGLLQNRAGELENIYTNAEDFSYVPHMKIAAKSLIIVNTTIAKFIKARELFRTGAQALTPEVDENDVDLPKTNGKYNTLIQ